jgi:hypothetical protein
MSTFEYHPVYETEEETRFWEAMKDPNFQQAEAAKVWVPTDVLLLRWEAGELSSVDARSMPEETSV